jgi:hypothetical protein
MQFTIDDNASGAFNSSHIIARHEAILTFVLREDSWYRESRFAAIKLLTMLGGSVVQNFTVLFPKDIWLGQTFNVTFECNSVTVATAQIL